MDESEFNYLVRHYANDETATVASVRRDPVKKASTIMAIKADLAGTKTWEETLSQQTRVQAIENLQRLLSLL